MHPSSKGGVRMSSWAGLLGLSAVLDLVLALVVVLGKKIAGTRRGTVADAAGTVVADTIRARAGAAGGDAAVGAPNAAGVGAAAGGHVVRPAVAALVTAAAAVVGSREDRKAVGWGLGLATLAHRVQLSALVPLPVLPVGWVTHE